MSPHAFNSLRIDLVYSQQVVAVLSIDHQRQGSRVAASRHRRTQTLLHGFHFCSAFPASYHRDGSWPTAGIIS